MKESPIKKVDVDIDIGWVTGPTAIYLPDVKQKLHTAMNRIESIETYSWHFYRKLLNPNEFTDREFASNRAFYKLWEVLGEFPLLLPMKRAGITSLHLAEAPGSFVQVVSRRCSLLRMPCKQVAVSRPPLTYAQVVKKSNRVPKFDEDLVRSSDCVFHYMDLTNSGDVAGLSNLVENGAHFVTADGGIDDERRYDSKEEMHYALILGEVVGILLNQRLHGSAVIKIFETFTETTVSILNLLQMHYRHCAFIKPTTSRATNSEKYMICFGFKGLQFGSSQLLSLLDVEPTRDMKLSVEISETFLRKCLEATRECSERQVEAIGYIVDFALRKEAKSKSHYIDRTSYNEEKAASYKAWKEKFGF